MSLNKVKSYILSASIKEGILYMLTLAILFHFLKDTYIQYYFILIFIFILVPIIIIIEGNYSKYLNHDHVSISFYIYLFAMFLTTIISIVYMDRWGMDNSELLIALGKFYICPIMCASFILLTDKEKYFKSILYIYVLFIILASLSIYIQEIFGHISFFGETFYHIPRYGKLGYSSITGSVNSYGICFFVAIFIIYFLTELNVFLKAIIISIIIFAALLVTSKSGFVNIGLTLLILFIYSFIKKEWSIFLLCLIILFLGIIFVDSLYIAFTYLFANTFGIEIVPNTKGIDLSTDDIDGRIYWSLWELAYERLSLRFFPANLVSIDYFIGIGVYGGGGAFGTNAISSHNSYVDTYIIGGIALVLSQLFLMLCVQINLLKEILYKNNNISLILFLSNALILFNLLFFNGGIYQPVISFAFWLSVAYLILKKINYSQN
tara:strand:+ start:3501 stop:4805 length:1305 start_codon:yes stop_codon:yes gene_type:complete